MTSVVTVVRVKTNPSDSVMCFLTRWKCVCCAVNSILTWERMWKYTKSRKAIQAIRKCLHLPSRHHITACLHQYSFHLQNIGAITINLMGDHYNHWRARTQQIQILQDCSQKYVLFKKLWRLRARQNSLLLKKNYTFLQLEYCLKHVGWLSELSGKCF